MYDDKLHQGADPRLYFYAKQNRKQQTEGENILWQQLKNRKFLGFKFRRQNPIADFVADFFCVECSLIVEVDGDYHQMREQVEYDKGRTFELSEFEITVVRFTNSEVIEHMGFVLNEIEKHLIPKNSSHKKTLD